MNVQKDFPILKRKINGKRLVYVDNAASSQKPKVVLDAMTNYYTMHNANVSRGIHTLADESTTSYDAARKTIAHFFNVNDQQVIFTSGTTDAMNFVAHHFFDSIQAGDEILLTQFEHHSNLLPWQRLAEKTLAKIIVVNIKKDGTLDEADFKKKITPRTVLMCLTHASNVFGTVLPIKKLTKIAQEKHIPVVVDGAQAAGHLPVNITNIGADFYALSAHKMLGPQGIGALIVSQKYLKKLKPYRIGGGAVTIVTHDTHSLIDTVERFEAGTPNVAGAIGFAVACEYILKQDIQKIHTHEIDVTTYAWDELSKIPQITLYGPNPHKVKERAAIVSFTVKGIHAHDVAQILDEHGVAIRSGTHCAQPLHDALELDALNRASFALYNTTKDVDVLVQAIKQALKLFGGDAHE